MRSSNFVLYSCSALLSNRRTRRDKDTFLALPALTFVRFRRRHSFGDLLADWNVMRDADVQRFVVLSRGNEQIDGFLELIVLEKETGATIQHVRIRALVQVVGHRLKGGELLQVEGELHRSSDFTRLENKEKTRFRGENATSLALW